MSFYFSPWINYQRESVLLRGKHRHSPLLERNEGPYACGCVHAVVRFPDQSVQRFQGSVLSLGALYIWTAWVGLWKVPVIRFDTNTRAAVAAAKAYLRSMGVSMNGRCEGRWKEQRSVTNNIRCAQTHICTKSCQLVDVVATRRPINSLALLLGGKEQSPILIKHAHT